MRELLVLTFKDGLLARLAHDLQIRATSFDAKLDGDAITLVVPLAKLKVEGAVEHGRVKPSVLSTSDLGKIERTMHDDVLTSARHPEARFEGTVDRKALRVQGRLTLHGRTVELAPIALREDGELLRAEVPLVPSRWGIAPYRALAGALKLQDRIVVRIALPRDLGGG